MADLPTQFEKAKSKVEPTSEDKDHAAEAHELVRACLEADPDLAEWGVDTILIGSYKRHVSIRRMKDVDVLSKLPDLPDDVLPADLLDTFEAVLVAEFGEERVDRQDRSVQVDFPDWDLYVDAVPARIAGDFLAIPDPDNPDSNWQETNPEELTTLSSAMNERYDEEYVPVVKLVRQARRAHLGKRRPGGLYFEILTYHAFEAGLDDRCTASLFVGALRRIADKLAEVVAGGEVNDPTRTGEVIKVRASDDDFEKAAEEFAALATKAEEALETEDRCAAAKKFRDILGRNSDDEWVFAMPAACNEDGTARAVAVIAPGERHVPAGDRRFA